MKCHCGRPAQPDILQQPGEQQAQQQEQQQEQRQQEQQRQHKQHPSGKHDLPFCS